MNQQALTPADTNDFKSYRVEFTIHMKCDKFHTIFRREEVLPFAPFLGLDMLDDALGEFKIEHVAWASQSKLFLCQSRVDRTWTIREACKTMKKCGWVEEKESRVPN